MELIIQLHILCHVWKYIVGDGLFIFFQFGLLKFTLIAVGFENLKSRDLKNITSINCYIYIYNIYIYIYIYNITTHDDVGFEDFVQIKKIMILWI